MRCDGVGLNRPSRLLIPARFYDRSNNRLAPVFQTTQRLIAMHRPTAKPFATIIITPDSFIIPKEMLQNGRRLGRGQRHHYSPYLASPPALLSLRRLLPPHPSLLPFCRLLV